MRCKPGRLPMLDYPTGGWIGGMQDAHRTVLRLANDTTKIVPATGPVMTKAEVQASLDLLTKVRDQLVKLMKQGKGAPGHDRREGREGVRGPAQPAIPTRSSLPPTEDFGPMSANSAALCRPPFRRRSEAIE